MTDLHLSNFGTLLPEAPCYVFDPTRHQIYCRFDTDDMSFVSTLFDFTHTNTHTEHIGTNRLTLHMNIYYHLLCAQSRYLLNQSLTDIKNLFCKGQQCLCFSNITHVQKSVICLLDSVPRLSPSCETQRILI